jgi:sporulation-control protein
MALLSRFGIGSAMIDLIPDETTVQPGGEVEAHLELEGGSADQTVDDIEIALVTRFQAEREDDSFPTQHVLWETEFKEGFTVEAGVDRSLDVPPIQVPSFTPVTIGGPEVWVQTGLDIEWAVDPSDEDQLDVKPGPRLQGVLDAMEQLGFTLRSVTNEESDSPTTPVPFFQRFTYQEEAGEEVLIRFLTAENENLLIRVTRPDRDEDPTDRSPLSINTDDVDVIAGQLRDKLSHSAQ